MNVIRKSQKVSLVKSKHATMCTLIDKKEGYFCHLLSSEGDRNPCLRYIPAFP